MNKKYQIFISSTYNDLKEEREQAIKAILEMGHIPVGMEMFSAADEEQWQLIARQIEETDYYVVILAHRYGSETPEGCSFTEKEYDYAISKGVPTLGFIIDEKAPWPSDRIDKSNREKVKLEKFKSKIKLKLVKFWRGKEDLHGKISISLIKAMNTNPREGWTRANEAIGPNITKELSRLSLENSKLREENQLLQKKQQDATDEVRKVVRILNNNSRRFKVRKTSDWKTAKRFEKTLLQSFTHIAPNLINENSSIEIARNLAFSLINNAGYYRLWPVPKNMISDLIADFVSLDLLEPSKKKHPVSDENSYWTLTKIGKQVLKRSRRIQLEEGIDSSSDNEMGV